MAAAEHIVMALLVLGVMRWAEGQQLTYNVQDFHAKGDGETDDAQAFLSTWQAACNDSGRPAMVVPGGRTFLLTQVTFQGPCQSPIAVQLDGKIIAPNKTWTLSGGQANIVTFYSINRLTVEGNGGMDGQGAIWWDCYQHKRCTDRPILLGFAFCTNLVVRDIYLTNSANKHMTLFHSVRVQVYNVSITAPGDSPNTDGITMAQSNTVSISNSRIGTGDDCISMLSHTENVNITDSECGPGHGISVGSLGGSEIALVENIRVSNCSFWETMTGVRIKSWQGANGYARGFLFEDLNMNAVQNPIVIDQFYCPEKNCPQKDGSLTIRDARYINIQGSSTEQDAIRLLCSQAANCLDIYFSNINLSWINHTDSANATVLNAHGTTEGNVVPLVRF